MKKRRRKRRKKPQYKFNVFDKILLCLGIFLLLFAVTMVIVFCVYQNTPDTLIMSVFGLCASECGFMAWIKRKDKELKGEKYNDNRLEEEII